MGWITLFFTGNIACTSSLEKNLSFSIVEVRWHDSTLRSVLLPKSSWDFHLHLYPIAYALSRAKLSKSHDSMILWSVVGFISLNWKCLQSVNLKCTNRLCNLLCSTQGFTACIQGHLFYAPLCILGSQCCEKDLWNVSLGAKPLFLIDASKLSCFLVPASAMS